MRIESIFLRNYRVFRNAELTDLPSMATVVGANGSGKSTLFDAMSFLNLERSIPRKLRAWREPGVRFAVVRDNDGGDRRARKEALRGLCEAARRPDTLIRLACQELEAWYLGEPEALAEAFGREALRDLARRPRIPTPMQWSARTRSLRTSYPSSRRYPVPDGWHSI